MMQRRFSEFASYLLGAAFIFLLWLIVAKIISIPIIPSPVLVAETLREIFFDSVLYHAAYSLWRIGAGIFLAVLIGLPLGVAMGYYPRVDALLRPVIYLAYPVPKVALLPICMLTLGLGEGAKISLIVLIVTFQVIVAFRDSILAIPQETYYPLYSLGAGFVSVFREVLWPASLPKFFTSLRVAMGTAISVLFFTETFGTKYGMGYFIMDAWLRVNYLEMYAGIVTLSFMGLFLFVMIDLIEYFLCPWNRSRG